MQSTENCPPELPQSPRVVIVPPFFPVYANDPNKLLTWAEWIDPHFIDPRLHDPTPPDGIGRVVRGLLSCSDEKVHLLAHGGSYTNYPHVTIHSIADEFDMKMKNATAETYEQHLQAAKERTIQTTKHLVTHASVRDINLHWTQADVAQELAALAEAVGGRLIVSLHNTPDGESKQIIELSRTNRAVQIAVLSTAHAEGFEDWVGKEEANKLHVVGSGLEMGRLYPYNDFLPLSETNDTPPHTILEALKFLGLDYLLIIGSLGPHKGQKSARAIAEGAGIPLVELGGLGAPNPHRGASVDLLYARDLRNMPGFIDCARLEVQQIIDKIRYAQAKGQTPFLGGLQVGEEMKQAFARFALGALCTSGIEWDYTEAWNLAAAEPQVNGTPTLTVAGSSIAERLAPGTGLVFVDIADAIQKIDELCKLPREQCARIARSIYDIRRAGGALRELDSSPQLSNLLFQLLSVRQE